MGVYIKGIKMPETCGSCRFNYFQEDECSWYSCSLLPRDIDQGSSGGFRQLDCPLVEVPEPHGRLIDGDELKTAFPTFDNSTPVMVASVRATINHAPTVIEAEGE